MSFLSIHDLVDCVGGRLSLGDLPPLGGEFEPVGRITLEMQQIEEGDVYLALPNGGSGSKSFVEEAFLRGAAGVISAGRHIEPWAGRFTIHVEDPAWAVWQLARTARERFQGEVLAVAGCAGKTIAASLIDAVLSTSRPGICSTNEGRHSAGLLAELIRLDEDRSYGVFELHAGSGGEMSSVAHLCRPHLAVVTNLGDGVSAARIATDAQTAAAEELLGSLDRHGFAVLAGDDPQLRRMASSTRSKVFTFGRDPDCDFVATHVACSGGRLTFCIDGQVLRVPVRGRHHLSAALAAWTVGRLLDVPAPEMVDAIEHISLPARRSQITELDGITLIDDTASRSVRSVEAALELLGELPVTGRRVVVCGELPASGHQACDACEQLGILMVAVCGADVLVAGGPHAGGMMMAAQRAGLPKKACRQFENSNDLLRQLGEIIRPGDAVLMKNIEASSVDAFAETLKQRRRQAAA